MSRGKVWKAGRLATTALLLFACLAARIPSASTAQTSLVWRAEYFDNQSLTGTPVAVVDEGEINHRWLNHGPGYGI